MNPNKCIFYVKINMFVNFESGIQKIFSTYLSEIKQYKIHFKLSAGAKKKLNKYVNILGYQIIKKALLISNGSIKYQDLYNATLSVIKEERISESVLDAVKQKLSAEDLDKFSFNLSKVLDFVYSNVKPMSFTDSCIIFLAQVFEIFVYTVLLYARGFLDNKNTITENEIMDSIILIFDKTFETIEQEKQYKATVGALNVVKSKTFPNIDRLISEYL